MKNRNIQFKATAPRCKNTQLLLACFAAAQKGAEVMRALTLPLLAVFATLTTDVSMANEVETKVIKDPQGAALSIIGRYDVGLEKGASLWSSSRVPAPAVGEAVSKFILDDRKRSGLSDYDNVRLVVKSVDRVDNQTVVAQVDQYVGELRVIDSDLRVVFTEDGFLQSLNGGVVPNRSPQARPALKLDRVLEILKNDAKAAEMGDLDGCQKAGQGEWNRKDGATIVVGWSRKYNSAVWKASLPEEIIWIDDKSGAIERRHSQRRYGPTNGCDVRHRNWPRAGNGKATSLGETSGATMVSRITCEANEWWGTCNWRLQRQPSGFKHPIDRVQDEDGAEAEVQLACTAGTRPTFTASNGDALREQGAFYIVNQMRFYMDKDVWKQVAPDRDANVDVHVDDRNVVYPGGSGFSGAVAWFDPFWTSIRSHRDRAQQETFMHEYGHYVVWTYGDLSYNCDQSRDEGAALNETLGNVFAGLCGLDSNEINPRYGAYWAL
jgi:hypothetical protein